MIEAKEETLESILVKGIQDLKSSESRVVSYTKKINTINPLLFFEVGSKLGKNRSFWKSTIDNFTLVGIGNAYTIQIKDKKINTLEIEWQKLLKEAVIHNDYEEPGVGIVTIGGMDFDPIKPQTSLWKNYGHHALRVPTFLLAVNEKDAYLTITVHVHAEDDPYELARHLVKQEEVLVTQQDMVFRQPTILHKEEIKPMEWKDLVQRTTKHIANSDTEKIVLARELQVEFQDKIHLTAILHNLMVSQPTSYIFAFEQDDDCFIGATPERLVKVENKEILSTCLAGTAARGTTEDEDERLGYQLLHDQKNLEEHDFVVQMIKESIEEFCKEIQIPNQPVLYKLRNLQHLYTPVRGKFKEGYSILDVVEKLHPTPALGGEPRHEALAYIREYEDLDRGWYGAPFGWMDSTRNGEFAVAIRSGLIKGDKASLFAGCGVVKDSNPEAEFEETRIKFLPMLTVLGG